MTQIHEVGGVHMKNKSFPGLNMAQATELLPSLQISDEQVAVFGGKDSDAGWFKLE